MTKLYYQTASEAGAALKNLCNNNWKKLSAKRLTTQYTKYKYKNNTYYISSNTSDKDEIEKEFLIQFDIKKTVRSILANIPEIQIDFQEYDGEHGVLDNENYEVKTDDHTIRFALYINDCKDIENIRVFSDTEWLEIQDPELEKIKRKLIKQINY
jgi:hypothetical protein